MTIARLVEIRRVVHFRQRCFLCFAIEPMLLVMRLKYRLYFVIEVAIIVPIVLRKCYH